MDVKPTASYPFQRISGPHHPPPPAPRRAEEATPIFDQLLKEWRAGELRPVVSWPVDEPGKKRVGAGVGTDSDLPRPRTGDEQHDRERVRRSTAHPDR